MKRYRQSALIIKVDSKLKPPKPEMSIFISRRTGYQNIWINGIHYYYNVHEQTDDLASIDLEKIAQQSQSNGKQLLVIRRK